MSQTVIGIFKTKQDAENAVDNLLRNGFSENNVDLSDQRNTENPAVADAADLSTEHRHEAHEHESGIARFFRNLFGSGDESERYTSVAKNNCVVTVHAYDAEEAKRAADLLDDYGAVDVDEHYRQYNTHHDPASAWGSDLQRGTANVDPVNTGVGIAGYDMNVGAPDLQPEYTEEVVDNNTGERAYEGEDVDRVVDRENFRDDEIEGRTLPVIEETINIGKREIETGGVRIRSRIVEKPVEETLRLRQERIRIERNAVDREAASEDIDNFREGTVELREREEVPVVSKEARVVEEISLDRDVEHREETIRDTVRNTEVEVEELERRKDS